MEKGGSTHTIRGAGKLRRLLTIGLAVARAHHGWVAEDCAHVSVDVALDNTNMCYVE